MRITVILPNEQQLDTAGVRIRYQRMAPAIRRMGHDLDFAFLGGFDTRTEFRSDVYLFSKCQDARALILAQRISMAGRLVGVDVFDDYFSQREDSRLVPLQRWWDDMRPSVDFLLCATPAMAERLGTLAAGLPINILNDPFEPFDPDAVASLIEAKVARARSTGILEVAWFGMGDNPIFPVGLDDLSDFGLALAELRSTGLSPRLRVLTNRRAMTPARMERLARLPLPVELGEWSVEAEADLLRESLVTVLPVNAQPFSTVKSLNRAVTALTSGTQVLSLGFGLYEPLGPFIYRSAGDLLGDLEQERLRLRRETMPAFLETLTERGEPGREAANLVAFLGNHGRSSARARPARATGAVIHGITSPTNVHNFAQRNGWLSVASPFHNHRHDFDMRFQREPDGTAAAVLSEAAASLLSWRDQARLLPDPESPSQRLSVLRLEDTYIPDEPEPGIVEAFVLYPDMMGTVRRILGSLFPDMPLLLSETAAPYTEALARVPSR